MSAKMALCLLTPTTLRWSTLSSPSAERGAKEKYKFKSPPLYVCDVKEVEQEILSSNSPFSTCREGAGGESNFISFALYKS